jgi:hypothetical protein
MKLSLPTSWGSFRSAKVLALFGMAMLISGCLTIEENYTFKKDGSGTLEYVVDLSEMGELMKGLPGGDGKDDGLGQMDMKDDLSKLKKLPGIRKVKLKKEKDGFVQRLSFRFADLSSLNGALNTLMPDSTGVVKEFFRWEGNTLVRANNRHANELGSGMGGEPGDSTDMTALLQSMHYKYSFKFAEDIAETHVAEGVEKMADGTKAVSVNTDWSVITKDPTALDLRIVLNRP